MSDDKFHDERVRRAGWTAGSRGEPKSANPHRDKGDEDERNWDSAWDDGAAGKEFGSYE